MARSKKLERIDAPESPFLHMKKEELLLDGSEGAKHELFRRSFNRMVKKSEQA